MGTKTNKVIDFAGDVYTRKLADIQVSGYLILNDTWVCDMHQMVWCVETNTFHSIIDFKLFEVYMLKPEKNRISGMFLRNGASNWEQKKFSCIKVEAQHQIKAGYTLVPKYSKDTSTLS
jgi:hypothetical protein